MKFGGYVHCSQRSQIHQCQPHGGVKGRVSVSPGPSCVKCGRYQAIRLIPTCPQCATASDQVPLSKTLQARLPPSRSLLCDRQHYF